MDRKTDLTEKQADRDTGVWMSWLADGWAAGMWLSRPIIQTE